MVDNKSKKTKKTKKKDTDIEEHKPSIKEETLRGVWAVLIFVLAIIFILAAFQSAGRLGDLIYESFSTLFGIGYYLIPLSLIILAIALFKSIAKFGDGKIKKVHSLSSLLFFISSLGIIESIHKTSGGIVGSTIATPLLEWLALPATLIILLGLTIVSVLILFDTYPHIPFKKNKDIDDLETEENTEENINKKKSELKIKSPMSKLVDQEQNEENSGVKSAKNLFKLSKNNQTKKDDQKDELVLEVKTISNDDYTPPPLSILRKNSGKPVVGDVKANANLIRRTLKNFGINVEMDEVSIGPTVTRYALKPAEGVRLNKIVGLQSNLELALAASPVRIEAPIPGKALVGIEVPNTSRTTIGLGSMFRLPEYTKSDKPLLVTLGGDISGKAHFTDIAKMPHLLIGGTTGSGKSVTVHDLILSLLYRSGPSKLRLLMVDPKRVELTLYNKIPHLLTPVITDPKKALLALKWLTKEMDRRYDVLQNSSVRDIQSYHANILAPAQAKKKAGKWKEEDKFPEEMPYIVTFIDELSDLMQAYPRELEAAIVRLTQMSRAVGIHLVLATQRPVVQVITGLIKANVPTRIALQVIAQIDSRTIIDTSGAEKLLGRGDMLYVSGETSKPTRIQAPFVSEAEVKKVVKYLRKAYENELDDTIDFSNETKDASIFEASIFDSSESEDDDELFGEAKNTVIQAGKASTSYLQRKLRIGYARAARLMDLLEERGVIGPADGSKAREVLVSNEQHMELDSQEEDEN